MRRIGRVPRRLVVPLSLVRVVAITAFVVWIDGYLLRHLIPDPTNDFGPFDNGPGDLVLKVGLGAGLAAAGAILVGDRGQRLTGLLLILSGVVWGMHEATPQPGPFGNDVFVVVASKMLNEVPGLLVFWAIMRFPRVGRRRWSRVAGLLLAGAIALELGLALFKPRTQWYSFTTNPDVWWPGIWDVPRVVQAFTTTLSFADLIGACTLPVLYLVRTLRLGGTDRRLMWRFAVGVVCAASIGPVTNSDYAFSVGLDSSGEVHTVLSLPIVVTWLWVALSTRSVDVGAMEAVASLGPSALPMDVRDELRRRVGDGGLDLFGTTADGEWVDVVGAAVSRTPQQSAETVVRTDRASRPVAAISGSDQGAPGRQLREGAATAAAVFLENQRILDGLQIQAAQVEQSLARLEALADLEKAWIRDLTVIGPLRRLARAGSILAEVAGDDGVAEDPVTRALGRVRFAREELAALIGGDPDALVELGLAAALRQALLHDSVQFDLRIPRLPVPIERLAYYLVTEIVANAVKHASATRIVVGIASNEGALTITVEDDGVGGVEMVPRGLGAFEPLLRENGGSVEFSSPAGVGTRVAARLIL